MAGLIDSIRDQIAQGDTEKKDEVTDNIKQTLELASRKLLSKVANNEVDLDVRDLKDLAAVSNLLQANSGDTEATGTPQAPKAMNKVFNQTILVTKDPQDDHGQVSQDDLINISSSDIDKMVKDQFNEQNELNYKANEA